MSRNSLYTFRCKLNVWVDTASDDPCFLDDEKLLEEYILNQSGYIYYGFASWGESGVKPRPWNYGQVICSADWLIAGGKQSRRFEGARNNLFVAAQVELLQI